MNQNSPYDKDMPPKSPSWVPALRRSDDEPGFGVMCGGKERIDPTRLENLEVSKQNIDLQTIANNYR